MPRGMNRIDSATFLRGGKNIFHKKEKLFQKIFPSLFIIIRKLEKYDDV